MTDLDQLLRDTLHGRAATVTETPPVAVAPARADRSRWLLVAATVATVLVVGGGVAGWGLGMNHHSNKAGGGYAQTCKATLPGAWKAALDGPRLQVNGRLASVYEVTPYGDVVNWFDAAGAEHLGLRGPTGTVRSMDDILSGRRLNGSGVEGRTLVLSVAPQETKTDPDPAVDDILAVDLRTLTTRDVLAEAQLPGNVVVADKAAAILNGTVYWAVVPQGTENDAKTGTVLAFDLSTGRTKVVGHAPNLLTGPDEPRGVYWAGGGVRARGVPTSIPRVRTNGYDPVVSDGSNFAWLRANGDQGVVGWADKKGVGRSWQVDTVGRSDIRSDPTAVSGPFVFLWPMGYGNARYYVLDTRTGAVADSGIEAFGGKAHGTAVALGTRANNHAPFSAVVLDTAKLPELHCR